MKFTSVLTLIFVVFKMLGYIDWSWWIVFSPMLVGGVIALVFLVLAGTFMALAKGRYV